MKFLKLFFFLAVFILYGCSSDPVFISYFDAPFSEKKSKIDEQIKIHGVAYVTKRWSKGPGAFSGCANALGCAVLTYDYELTEYLLELGADPNDISPDYSYHNYPIQNAIDYKILIKGDRDKDATVIKFIDLLVKYGARTDVCFYNNPTPINIAIEDESKLVVEHLININASLEPNFHCSEINGYYGPFAKDSVGPLAFAIQENTYVSEDLEDILRQLLEAGLDIFDIGYSSNALSYMDAITYAKRFEKFELADDILKIYIDVNQLSENQINNLNQKLAKNYQEMLHINRLVREDKIIKERERAAQRAKNDAAERAMMDKLSREYDATHEYTDTPLKITSVSDFLGVTDKVYSQGNTKASSTVAKEIPQVGVSYVNTKTSIKKLDATTVPPTNKKVNTEKSIEKAQAYCWENKNGKFSCYGPLQKTTTTWKTRLQALELVGCKNPGHQRGTWSVGINNGAWFTCYGSPLNSYDNGPIKIQNWLNKQ